MIAPETVGSAEAAAPAADLAVQPVSEQASPAVAPADTPFPVPLAGTDGPFPRAPVGESIPAGRTWMERVGSHALVLRMLLIVVAAAVLTGRKTGDPSESDDSIAASAGQEIRFDSQGQPELPIPDHLHLTTPVEMAIDHSAAQSTMDSAEPRALEPFVSAEDRAITSKLAIAETTGSDATFAGQSGAAALSEPQVNRVDSMASAVENSAVPGTSGAGPRVDANQFSEGSTSVGATTVSNRTVLEDEALAVPTLEDLESSAGIMADTRGYDGPNFSRTPFGITDSDLLLHLDELIQRSSRPATGNPAASYSAAASPTSSN